MSKTMSNSGDFMLALFSVDQATIREAVSSGVAAIMVDWESRGKLVRQANADTQINHHTLEDLQRVRASTSAKVICRLNSFQDEQTREELERAICAGADEILLPMVRTVAEVETLLRWTDHRARVGILVETDAAVLLADELGRLPLERVYVGLNDLSIDRGYANIFTAILDGTLENVRPHFPMQFGFGGLTLPDRGYPIPCRLLIGEMARLKCDFSFLRRSFYRDIRGRVMSVEIPRILDAIVTARNRSPEKVTEEKRELDRVVGSIPVKAMRDSQG